jgi:hypothetical protein
MSVGWLADPAEAAEHIDGLSSQIIKYQAWPIGQA